MSESLLFATHNRHKVAELRSMLPSQITIIDAATMGLPAPPETAATFIENALLKARHASAASGLAALADDSGLMVPALASAPGVHSARYAGDDADDAANRAKLLHAMRNIDDRRAVFICTLVYVRHAQDPDPLIGQGYWHGSIHDRAEGDYGFGYDPLFWLPAQGCTVAALAPAYKQQHSHRAQALAHFLQRFQAEVISDPQAQ